MERVVSLVIGYVLGLIQTGYFYGKFHGVDLRKHGSGNSGATNTLRVMGKTAGLIVLFGDLMKSFAACLIVRLLFSSANPEMTLLYVLYAGAGAVLGHDFPFYLKFKGGKGVASTSGMIIALLDIRIFLDVSFLIKDKNTINKEWPIGSKDVADCRSVRLLFLINQIIINKCLRVRVNSIKSLHHINSMI